MLTFKEYITEIRKLPELNPRLSVYDQLEPYSKNEDIFISFTDINKLGINPLSHYKTPLGIYCYPLKETWIEYNVEKTKSLKGYPFASDRKYVYVLKWSGKGILKDVSDYTNDDLKNDIEKIYKMYTEEFTGLAPKYKYFELDDNLSDIKGDLAVLRYENKDDEYHKLNLEYQRLSSDQVYQTIKQARQTAKFKEPDSIFFNICRWFANDGDNPDVRSYTPIKTKSVTRIVRKSEGAGKDKDFKEEHYFDTNSLTVNWNKLLRKLGYAGFTDREGKGTIFSGEPIQAFFTSKEYVTQIKVILNKSYSTKSNTNSVIVIDSIDTLSNHLNTFLSNFTFYEFVNYFYENKKEEINGYVYQFSSSFTKQEFKNFLGLQFLKKSFISDILEDSLPSRILAFGFLLERKLEIYKYPTEFALKLIDKIENAVIYIGGEDDWFKFLEPYNLINRLIEKNYEDAKGPYWNKLNDNI